MPVNVYITVDVESSMGGAWGSPSRLPLPASRHVFCENLQGRWGLPLIVDELKKHGMKATFFCEMLATRVLGEADTRPVTDYLLGHGQDVQLHVHPTFRHFDEHLRRKKEGDAGPPLKNDLLSTHSESEQRDLIGEGCELFERITGSRPSAFRAGCFAADRVTLRILRGLNVAVDSSFDPCYRFLNGSFRKDPPEINRAQRIEGVFEFPITVARTWSLQGPAYKHFNISAISFPEMKRILNVAWERGMEHVVALIHCFSTVKPRSETYEVFRPNRIVILRWRKLLRYLNDNASRFSVRTFGEIKDVLAGPDPDGSSVIPHLGFWRPVVRKAVQGWNNLYWT